MESWPDVYPPGRILVGVRRPAEATQTYVSTSVGPNRAHSESSNTTDKFWKSIGKDFAELLEVVIVPLIGTILYAQQFSFPLQ